MSGEGYGAACMSCGRRHDHATTCRHADRRQVERTPLQFEVDDRITWRGRTWAVADVQDDEQHVHLTIVPTSAHPEDGDK